MKAISILIISFTLIIAEQCDKLKKNKKNQNQENAFERENSIISEYHKQVVISKGGETFFIPKEEIPWYFSKGEFLPIENSQSEDNISFFDTLGNIEYQAIIVSRSEEKTILKCQDLSTAEYYITELNIDSIRDLKKDYPYTIKVYRHNK
jgi:Rps23 Pro-64 3,4-dihydroxylase Tpa1-like proline 4-hydroxylase